MSCKTPRKDWSSIGKADNSNASFHCSNSPITPRDPQERIRILLAKTRMAWPLPLSPPHRFPLFLFSGTWTSPLFSMSLAWASLSLSFSLQPPPTPPFLWKPPLFSHSEANTHPHTLPGSAQSSPPPGSPGSPGKGPSCQWERKEAADVAGGEWGEWPIPEAMWAGGHHGRPCWSRQAFYSEWAGSRGSLCAEGHHLAEDSFGYWGVAGKGRSKKTQHTQPELTSTWSMPPEYMQGLLSTSKNLDFFCFVF